MSEETTDLLLKRLDSIDTRLRNVEKELAGLTAGNDVRDRKDQQLNRRSMAFVAVIASLVGSLATITAQGVI